MLPALKSNPELGKLFDWLRSQPNPAELIEQIDFQLLAYKKNPDLYILPNSCKWMTPALEEYGNYPEGWLRFVRYFTNQYPKRSETRMGLQAVYKRIYARDEASIRRRRVRRAINAHIALHGPFENTRESDKYGHDIQHWWSVGRKNLRGAYRAKTGKRVVPEEKGRELLDDYWDQVDVNLDEQKVPHKSELKQLIAEAARLHVLYYGKPFKDADSQ